MEGNFKQVKIFNVVKNILSFMHIFFNYEYIEFYDIFNIVCVYIYTYLPNLGLRIATQIIILYGSTFLNCDSAVLLKAYGGHKKSQSRPVKRQVDVLRTREVLREDPRLTLEYILSENEFRNARWEEAWQLLLDSRAVTKINLSCSHLRAAFPVSLCGVNDEHHEEKLRRDIFTIEAPARRAQDQRHERTNDEHGRAAHITGFN